MLETLKFHKVFAVRFRKLERWSVAFFHEVQWKWPDDVMDALGSCLLRVRRPIDCCPEDAPIIEKITFGGELSTLPEGKRKGYKGKLFRAEHDQLIYSKIRVKQGSVCVVPRSYEWVAVSSEYPVYSLEKSRINASYLELVLRSSAFKHYLDGLSHGGSTKTRIAPEEFEKLRIPVPPLKVQQAIAAFLHESQDIIDITKKRVSQMEQKMAGQFISVLGLTLPKPVECLKVFAAHWKEFDRWSVSYNQTRQSAIDLALGKYPVVDLGSVLETVQYGTSDKANNHEEGIPIIRMNNIIGGELDLSDLKYIRLHRKKENSLLLNLNSASRGE